ncbi:aromatic ring-hydroxylating dioxygenase subunit alpha [Marinobacterium mangrovicola]|uniref:Vanillate O-demethylase monooxygenase subunit n=1 Tax=Marinobacterium mangrovicola TaxID=1476959 RepID=A0A4R1G977_9GAMM|nr:aromatic ring-hydroxylating dioxygenase subunit alpha [Marinobacterium mangrovicola]TCK04198.1 vanillate O-demethylase monooxygenase subunit [Marinobacterium mangrovicola]
MNVSLADPATLAQQQNASKPEFPLDMWYVAALSKELTDKPIGRTLLNQSVVLFRTPDGQVAALENRCCHRDLPLSYGTVEESGIRCGYHGLLFDGEGKCLEVPGQDRVPRKAFVSAYSVKEQDSLVWIWFGSEENSKPSCEPPRYEVHTDERYVFDGGVFYYEAPYQLIHDNLLDLSHLGYVHLRTIGGNAKVHMGAEMKVEGEGDTVRVVRHMRNSTPPPTYTMAYPFEDKVDRWQEIEFHPSHLRIWTGAVNANTESLDSPDRGGFHMRGFHAITPETAESSHYFWTVASNPATNKDEINKIVTEQSEMTFEEDKVVIEAQYQNMKRFADRPMVDIHVDVGPNRARRIIKRMCAGDSHAAQ